MTANLTLKPEQKAQSAETGNVASYAIPRYKLILKNLLWLPVAIVIVLAALEGLFLVTHVGEEDFFHYEPFLGYRHFPSKLITYRSEGFSQGRMSKEGLRDREYSIEKPAGVKRIAFLGDSLTEGIQVDLFSTFAKKMECMLNGKCALGLSSTEGVEVVRPQTKSSKKYEVINFGCSAYGTVQEYLAFLSQARQYKPDICILCYSITDIDENTMPSDAAHLPPRAYVRLDKAQKLALDWRAADYWFNTQRGKLFRRIHWLRENSRIWGVISRRESLLSEDKAWKSFMKVVGAPAEKLTEFFIAGEPDLAIQKPTLAQVEGPGLEAPFVASPALEQRIARCKLTGQSKETAELQQYMIAHAQKIKVASALMSRLNAACHQIGCKFVLVGMPAFNNSLLYLKEFEVFEDQAKKEGFTFIDLHTPWPAADKDLDPRNWKTRYCGMHFTERGHEYVANGLYIKLVEAGVLPRKRHHHKHARTEAR
jgi:hypothetical protein